MGSHRHSSAESIYNDAESRQLRRRIQHEYKTLIARAKENDYEFSELAAESLEIRDKPAYKRNHARLLKYAFDMPLAILSKYADAVTRLMKHNVQFMGVLISNYASMTDGDLLDVLNLTTLANFAYIGRKAENPLIRLWALRMFTRVTKAREERVR